MVTKAKVLVGYTVCMAVAEKCFPLIFMLPCTSTDIKMPVRDNTLKMILCGLCKSNADTFNIVCFFDGHADDENERRTTTRRGW